MSGVSTDNSYVPWHKNLDFSSYPYLPSQSPTAISHKLTCGKNLKKRIPAKGKYISTSSVFYRRVTIFPTHTQYRSLISLLAHLYFLSTQYDQIIGCWLFSFLCWFLLVFSRHIPLRRCCFLFCFSFCVSPNLA